MSLHQARLTEIMEELVKTQLMAGRMPTAVEITRWFNERTATLDPSKPRMQLRLQGYRTRFNRKAYNTTVEEMVADMQLLFQENVGTAVRVLNSVNSDDIRAKSMAYQTAIVDDMLEDLLMVEPGAMGYLFGVYDSFNDFSKVDQVQTTCDVDLETGVVRLPISGGVNRMNLSFLINRARARLRFTPPDVVIDSALVPGAKFGNLFDDIIGSVWQSEVRSSTDEPLTAEFQVAVAVQAAYSVEEAERRSSATESELDLIERSARHISRIDIDPLTETDMQLKVLHSIDGQNWTMLPNHPPVVTLGSKRVSFRFEKTLIKYLKFQLTTLPDATVQSGALKQHIYHYGLKSIALYNAGYSPSAELISNVLSPVDVSGKPMARVALNVDEMVPLGTDIEYYISENITPPFWRRISSGTRDQQVAPAIVDFAGGILSSRNENQIRIQTTPSQNSQRNGIVFYNLGLAVDSNFMKCSSRLFRGIKSWRSRINRVEQTHQVKSNYVVFTLSDNKQKLYLEIEDERIANLAASQVGQTTTIFTGHEIFKDESVPVVPVGNVPKENPNYSIRQLMRIRKDGGAIGTATTEGGSTGDPNIPLGRAKLTILASSIDVELHDKQPIWVEYASGLSAFFRIVSFAQVGSDQEITVDDPKQHITDAVSINWSINADNITASIVSIDQNSMVLSASQVIEVGDELSVSYRRPLGPEHTLTTSSIVVKDNTGGTTKYKLGVDYTIDAASKAIARLPDGGIQALVDQTVVRVDFQYTTMSADLHTYTAFFTVDSDEPKNIELAAAFGVDESVGERVFIDDGIRVYDITNETQIPPLPRGWRQMTVRSKPIRDTAGVIDTTSAICKVLTALDTDGNTVFVPNSAYFRQVSAFPESLRETNLFDLQTGTLKDDRVKYAVDGTGVIINWNPTDMPDTIYPVVDVTGGMSLLDYEEFELQYRYFDGTPPDPELLFKAVLERDRSTKPTVTPELRSYNIRFGF